MPATVCAHRRHAIIRSHGTYRPVRPIAAAHPSRRVRAAHEPRARLYRPASGHGARPGATGGRGEFSRFHFHRVFAAWMGETLGDYARRRRLESAAFHLSPANRGLGAGNRAGHRIRVRRGICARLQAQVWLHRRRPGALARRNTEAGQMAAARERHANRHGIPDSNPDQVLRNASQADGRAFTDHGDSQQAHGERNMEVRIIDLPEVRVAYQRHIGPYGPAIGTFWREAVAPWMHANGLSERTCYGIGHDAPRHYAAGRVPLRRLRGGTGSVPARRPGQHRRPAGRTLRRGTILRRPATIGEAWMWLTREWLPSSGMQCDERPCFERFSAVSALDQRTGVLTCELCIPVRAL
ncbi:AraC family transcriptional regulator [Cupriavidus basilensis]